ncbi:hypothetical protein WI60_30120 [Burkholderia cepacia]|nr:hypothetical protein WI60_30120 [Burkholderia cepacia]KVC00950.1 hypothetical protein WI66_07470 [Burkholderia cepacia]KVC05310.1 hypothetical protein WI68_12180 [Burkholderia cepacia]
MVILIIIQVFISFPLNHRGANGLGRKPFAFVKKTIRPIRYSAILIEAQRLINRTFCVFLYEIDGSQFRHLVVFCESRKITQFVDEIFAMSLNNTLLAQDGHRKEEIR